VSGRPVTLVFEQRRMACEPCGRRFAEMHPAFEGHVTARLARRLVADARAMTVNAAAKRHKVGWRLVNALVVAWAGLVAAHRRRRRCRGSVGRRDLDPQASPVCDGARERRHRRDHQLRAAASAYQDDHPT